MKIESPMPLSDNEKIIRFLDNDGFMKTTDISKPTFKLSPIENFVKMESKRKDGIADKNEGSVSLMNGVSKNCNDLLISCWSVYPSEEKEFLCSFIKLYEATKDEDGKHKNFAIVSTVGEVRKVISNSINSHIYHGMVRYYSENNRFEHGDNWHYDDEQSMLSYAEAFYKTDNYSHQKEYRFLIDKPKDTLTIDESGIISLIGCEYILKKYFLCKKMTIHFLY